MRLDRVKTPEQLARFLKADHYWYTGFGGTTLFEPRDGFTFLVRVSKDGTVDAMVMADYQHVALRRTWPRPRPRRTVSGKGGGR